MMSAPQHALYVPQIAIEWLGEHASERTRHIDSTVMFADISGFTALSEQLMHDLGERGAEVLTSVINRAFGEIVEIVLLEHGDLLRFGGDAVLAMFTGDGHAGRAARAAVDIRDAIGDVETPGEPLGISIGLATGMVTIDRVGDASQELIVLGETIDRMLAAESAVSSGEIGIDTNLAESLPSEVVGSGEGGPLLLADPDTEPLLDDPPEVRVAEGVHPDVFISPDLRDRLTLTLQDGQHRTVSIGFIKVSGLSALNEAERTKALGRLFGSVIDRCGANAVSYLAADVDKDGAKFILAAGVPNRVRTKDGLAAALFEIVKSESTLAVSGGSAYGSVYAGDLGAPGRRCYTVMGDTVNLAARLASAAQPGEVWTTAAAMDRTAAVFETTTLDPIALKGKSKEVSPIRLDTLDAHTDEDTRSLQVIGRRAEVASVHRIAVEGLSGNGTVIVVTGADGMGKGTIAAAATDGRGEINVSLRCTDRWEGLHGIARRLVQLTFGTTAEYTTDGLSQAVAALAPDLVPWVPLLGDVLGVDIPPTPETAALSTETYLGKVHDVVVRLLTSAYGDRQAVLRVEDASLADETSVGLLKVLAQSVANHPWVMIVTSLSVPEWVSPDAPVVRIKQLDQDRARRFVLEVLGEDTLPAPIIDEIIQRAAGRPAALREMAVTSLEGGTVPETIEAAALAQIDRLDNRDRQLLSYAAVFGLDARIDLLAAILPEMSTAVEDPESWMRLSGFIDTEVVGRIKFRDAIHRDVAYQVLSHERRLSVHALAAEAIEHRARRRPERFVTDLAYHFHLAEVWDKSWKYSRMAADRALHGQAPLLAIRALERAAEAGSHLDLESVDLSDLHERLGDAFERAGMFDRAVTSFAAAADHHPDPEESWRLRVFAGRALVRLGKPDEARVEFDAVLENAVSVAARAEALTGIAGLEIRMGHFEEAAAWCDRVFAETDEESAVVARAHYIRATASTQEGWSDATEHAKRALEIYTEIGDITGQANALNNLGYHAFYVGDWGRCEEYHRESLAARTQIGDVLGRALASYNLGELLVEQGRLDEADVLLQSALADFRGAGHLVGEAATRLTIGRLDARLGLIDMCLDQLTRAETIARSASADEQLVDSAFARCELSLLTGAETAGLDALDPASLSPVQRARYSLLLAVTDSSLPDRRSKLEEAATAAGDVGLLHLVQLGMETLFRLYGAESDRKRALVLSDRLQLRARPRFRIHL